MNRHVGTGDEQQREHHDLDHGRARLAIRNTAPPDDRGAGALASTGSGLGLAGLRHRVEVVHGTMRAEATRDGGFCLEAELPAYVPTAEPVR